MKIMNEEFIRRVRPNVILRAERDLKHGVITQKEYDNALGRGPATSLDEIKQYLTSKITVEEFEERYGSGDKDSNDKYWQEIKKLMVESDELWEFKVGEAFATRWGVFIIRDGEIAAQFIFGIS